MPDGKTLRELHGEVRGDVVVFDCPVCGGEPGYGFHRIRLLTFISPRSNSAWTRSGDTIDKLTISPSIDCTKGHCLFHGRVNEGRVTWAPIDKKE